MYRERLESENIDCFDSVLWWHSVEWQSQGLFLYSRLVTPLSEENELWVGSFSAAFFGSLVSEAMEDSSLSSNQSLYSQIVWR